MNAREIKYLELLSHNFPNVPATAAEIVRLRPGEQVFHFISLHDCDCHSRHLLSLFPDSA